MQNNIKNRNRQMNQTTTMITQLVNRTISINIKVAHKYLD